MVALFVWLPLVWESDSCEISEIGEICEIGKKSEMRWREREREGEREREIRDNYEAVVRLFILFYDIYPEVVMSVVRWRSGRSL